MHVGINCNYIKEKTKNECKNYREVIGLSVAEKMYARVMIARLEAVTQEIIREESYGFRRGKGCVYQLFVVRRLIEKA